MGVRTIKLLSVLTAVVRTFGSNGAKPDARTRGYNARQTMGSQVPSYGISSTLPPMR